MTLIKPDAWQRLQELFEEALRQEPCRRGDFVAEACAGNRDLQARLEELLAADELAEEVLEPSETSQRISARALEDAAATIPRQIAHYQILREIASGGMGTVYEAQQDEPRRTVALKVMRLNIATRSAQRRFQYESELLAKLQHPGVAQVFEAGTYEDRRGPVPYFAMEYIPEARPITEYAEHKELDLPARLNLFADVCDAVHYGHQKGVIHRDLKPGNILVDGEGRARVIDFGVARSTDADVALTTMQTSVGQLIGTLQYMSPEQCEADPCNIDIRSDVYALGVVLYELLGGKPPYDVKGLTLQAATQMVREQPPARLSRSDARLRGDLEMIVRKALAKEREGRYRSAAELADDLRRYLAGEAILARPPSFVYQLRVFARRNKSLVAGVAAALAALTLGIIATGIERDKARRSEAEALAVTTFLTETLSSVQEQPEVTLREVLDEAARRLQEDESFADQPRVKATLHATIGNAYCSYMVYNSQAEKHLRAALQIRRRIFGPEHAQVAEILDDLAIATWHKRGNQDECGRLLREALAMRRKLLGDQHPDTLESIHHLASYSRDGGDVKAEQLYREALPGRQEVLRKAPPAQRRAAELAVAETHHGLGVHLYWCERFDEGETELRRALEIRTRLLDDGHPLVAQTMSQLARLLFEKSEFDGQAHLWEESEQMLRRALRIQRERLAPEYADPVHTATFLARCLMDKGRPDEAETVLREALEKRRLVDKARGRQSASAARIAVNLGECLTKLGRYDQAEKVLRQAYFHLETLLETLRKDVDADREARMIRRATQQLVALYVAWGKPDEADKWRAKLPQKTSPQE